ncbi:KAT8 regulatory NSL complex subunit 2-like [Uloborus diversus]|uniref:KAT8 regulatory NSL complex subunit 2-like n=1 Tax=Uloborus diversus TaxID=327109 RepID=UPI00240A604F|nr:KAT8 regulatory NSL complex subunit 2-like [Uloborus diversus]
MSHSPTKKVQQFGSERFCRYIHRYCYQPRLDGFEYCIRHILEDKNAPFKQCSFVHPNNKKRCTNAAPKSEKNERRDTVLCPFHMKQALRKGRSSRIRRRVPDGPSGLLKKLEHYCTKPNHDKSYVRSTVKEKSSRIPTVGHFPLSLSTPGNLEDEGESCDIQNTGIRSIEENPEWLAGVPTCLRHAGVFTSKELLKFTVEKIKRLQKAYCNELESIQHKLLQNQREVASLLKKQPEGESSLDFDQMDSVESKLLKSMLSYRHLSHTEKLLHFRAEQKRAALGLEDLNVADISFCSFEENGNSCSKRALLLTKFCRDHILSDPNQVLYKPCRLASKENCNMPVLPFEECCDKHIPRTEEQVLKMQAPLPLPDLASTFPVQDPDNFLSLEEMSSTGFEVTPEYYFNALDAGGESTESVISDDHAELLEIEPITLKPPLDILCDSGKSDSETEKQ